MRLIKLKKSTICRSKKRGAAYIRVRLIVEKYTIVLHTVCNRETYDLSHIIKPNVPRDHLRNKYLALHTSNRKTVQSFLYCLK